jgi:trimethylamine---corrinoid protein Co-methyltransferase
MTRGVVVDDETLALDVIEELGPTGDYLGHAHTLRHFKEPFYSKLADKGTYSQWQERGGTTMEERAARQVARILETHRPEPLAPDVQQGLKKVVEAEQERISTV